MLLHLSLGDPTLVGECMKKENEMLHKRMKVLGIT
jgi:hypothetical protein